MAEIQGTPSRLLKGVAVLVSLVGMAFGFVSPSDARHD
jgi:hypothetical protein